MEYVYGALLLHKLGKEISEDNLKKVISAAGNEADEAKVKVLVASLKGLNIDQELEAASLAAASPAAGEKKEEEKEEKKEEKASEAAEGLSALFG
jgi:large subunit ribosomal protein L12